MIEHMRATEIQPAASRSTERLVPANVSKAAIDLLVAIRMIAVGGNTVTDISVPS